MLIGVDVVQRKMVEVNSFGIEKPIPVERAGLEYWRQSTWELWFGPYSAFVSARLRAAKPDQTEVELWFPTRVHDAVYGNDPDGKNVDTKVKSELMRLLIGVATATRAEGFGYGFVDDDTLFGPPPLDLLRGFVQGDFHTPLEGQRDLLVAGLGSQHLDASRFVYDTDTPRVHYRQSGYDLYDFIWPVDAFRPLPRTPKTKTKTRTTDAERGVRFYSAQPDAGAGPWQEVLKQISTTAHSSTFPSAAVRAAALAPRSPSMK